MIAVIDYDMGNLRSVQKGFEAVGEKACVTRSPKEIFDSRAVVLPGVGAFRDCMANLERFDLIEIIYQSIRSGKPFLGICLGLQLLFSQSEEFGQIQGLDVLPGKVSRFVPHEDKNGETLKVPHMGWNRVRFRKNLSLFDAIPDLSYFYFVHSYYVMPENLENVATTTQYGIDFVSGVQHENIYAFQFHPEKSQRLGLQILKSFAELK